MSYINLDNINNVLSHLYDSVNGLRECAEQSKAPSFKQTLLDVVLDRQQFIDEIKSELDLPSEEFVTHGSVAGPLHRLYIDLKALVTSGDAEAINKEIKRGDDKLIGAYQEAIDDEENELVKNLLSRQLAIIQDNLLQIDEAALTAEKL